MQCGRTYHFKLYLRDLSRVSTKSVPVDTWSDAEANTIEG